MSEETPYTLLQDCLTKIDGAIQTMRMTTSHPAFQRLKTVKHDFWKSHEIALFNKHSEAFSIFKHYSTALLAIIRNLAKKDIDSIIPSELVKEVMSYNIFNLDVEKMSEFWAHLLIAVNYLSGVMSRRL